jgi:hypothetical protein
VVRHARHFYQFVDGDIFPPHHVFQIAGYHLIPSLSKILQVEIRAVCNQI